VCQFVSLSPGFAPSKLGIARPRQCIRLVPAVSEILALKLGLLLVDRVGT
jgi:hypothetical protein